MRYKGASLNPFFNFFHYIFILESHRQSNLELHLWIHAFMHAWPPISTDIALYQTHFTIVTCARPFCVHCFFTLFFNEGPPPPRSTPWGAYSYTSISTSAHQPGEMHIASAFTLLRTPVIIVIIVSIRRCEQTCFQ